MPKQYNLPGFIRRSDGPDRRKGNTSRKRRNAAVLIPLLQRNRQWEVLYIRRTENPHDYHSGQVAFPGGKQDPRDITIKQTALREAEEEIGLSNNQVEVLGQLKPYNTISDFQIHPFVSMIPWPLRLKAQQSEVARIFTIPLSWLNNEENYYLKVPQIKADHILKHRKRYPAVYYKRYDGELLWGATARMTLTLLQALDQGEITLE